MAISNPSLPVPSSPHPLVSSSPLKPQTPPPSLSFPPPPPLPPPLHGDRLRGLLRCGAGDLRLARAAHALAAKSGALDAVDPGLSDALLCAYLRAGRLADACRVFDEMPRPNVASYSALISGLAKLGGPVSAAAALFCRMRLAGVAPNDYTFVALLKHCIRRASPRLGSQVHALAVKSHYCCSLHVSNALLAMYVKSGRFDDALNLFDGMQQRDVCSWNTVLSALVEEGRYGEVPELFHDMRTSGVAADWLSLSALLTAAGEGFGPYTVEAVHALSLKSGLEMDLSIGNALIGFYARYGASVEDASDVFERMPVRDVISWTGMLTAYMEFGLVSSAVDVFHRMPERNHITYNTLLTGFCQNKEGLRGLQLFRQMVEDGLEVSDVTVTGVVNACAIAADRKKSEQVHSFVIKSGCGSSSWIDAALIDMCVKCGRSEDADQILEQWRHEEGFNVAWTSLLLRNVRDGEYEKAFAEFLFMFKSRGVQFVDEYMMTTILGVCGALGFAEVGKQMHCFAAKCGVLCNLAVGNALISMYGECGELKDAESFFDRMPCRDQVSWNALMTAFLLHHQGDRVLNLWAQMNRLAIKPDSVTFILIISACRYTSSNSADLSQELLLSMASSYNIQPAMEHYAAIVYVLGYWGCFDRAEQLTKSMPFKPDASVWRSLLDSCRERSNLILGRQAMQHLLTLEPQDPSTYILASNLYALSARWHCSEKTRQEMHQKGLRKIPARSWTVSQNAVHSFYARDQSHPQSKDIYAGLDVLILECMKAGYEPDTRFVMHEVEEYQKRYFLMYHSAKLATMYGLLMSKPGQAVRVVKNIRMCGDCHSFMKYASAATGKEISVRDTSGFHVFKGGQ